MTEAEKLADFAVRIRSSDLGDDVRLQLKIRVLDALGCAIGALGSPLAAPLREHMKEFGADGACMLIGGGRSAPDRAAFFNSALVRYLDFSDSYLAKGETCHPSDNLGAVLAACEYAGRSGADFLTALAVAYQVQCRLSDVAPVRAKGFDHTVQGSYALAAGVAKALGLDAQRTAHALAICGTAFNALRVTRTGALSNWKGLAYANTAFGCTHAALLAMHGITGPLEVFEGDRGFMQSIAGPFELDWSREGLDRIGQTILKRYNAEIHSQSAIDAVLELRRQMKLTGREVERVDVEIFDVAFRIIGGGEGDKRTVRTKEEADHSLPYLIAVALLDGEVMPAQYAPERIVRADVQDLLRRVEVRPSEEFSARFPREVPCRVSLQLKDGRAASLEVRDYEGFTTRPATWESALEKFRALAEPYIAGSLADRVAGAVAEIERMDVRDLAERLGQVTPVRIEREEGVLQYGP
ncbi:MAG TPA: MmgE/PrpD family protein [Bryobacteraceae bacterium]|jgi:2-methylcitrate dehydratase|nr:MmgE/PrpD family protein [Bryobacteraceae bacterium]